MRNRSIGKMVLLLIVTLGIFRLYYLIATSKEMMARDSSIKILSPWYLIGAFALLFIVPSVAVPLLVFSTAFNDSGGGIATAIFFTVYYISIFVFYAAILVWGWSYSKAVDKTTGGKLSFPIALIMMIFIPGIDIFVFQDYFNKINGT